MIHVSGFVSTIIFFVIILFACCYPSLTYITAVKNYYPPCFLPRTKHAPLLYTSVFYNSRSQSYICSLVPLNFKMKVPYISDIYNERVIKYGIMRHLFFVFYPYPCAAFEDILIYFLSTQLFGARSGGCVWSDCMLSFCNTSQFDILPGITFYYTEQ